MLDAWWATLQDDGQRWLPRLRDLLAEFTGLRFPPERWTSIERAVELIGKQQGFSDARSWLEWFVTSPPTLQHLEPLVSQLTIGETYFFRDKPLFNALRATILPELIARRRGAGRQLRLWSAGCSTGEEPYSVAILLKRLLPDWRAWQITLLATDINPQSLAKARLGRYDNWSFRNGLPNPHDADFERVGSKSFAVAAPIKTLVRFEQLNLAQDTYTADCRSMDIIFCRNVLMYLEPACARAVIDKLCRCLVDGGWLILSAVEAALVEVPQLTSVRFDDLHLFQKQSIESMQNQSAERFAAPKIALASAASVSELNPVTTFDPAVIFASTLTFEKNATSEKAAQIATTTALDAPATRAATSPPAESTADILGLIALARANADSGRLAQAADYCRAAIEADKLDPNWTELLASILLEQGDMAAAEAALKRTLYLDQNRALTHVALGNLLLREAYRRAEAQRHFRTALEILKDAAEQQILPETDGMTVAQLRAIIETTVAYEMSA
jgi:chemotaxis protein methyltransferase CheR